MNHPNLLQIRHLETRSDSPYVIMELMDGGDVDEQLAANGGRLSTEKTLSIMKQTCSALSALHNERVIHLDLKPQNLLMNSDGTVKLSDFGISSSLKKQRDGHSGSGTLFYAPPEQMDGGQCDVRTDIYALGMMTGQLLSGRFPFALKRAEEVKEWHLSGSRDFGYLPSKVAQVLAKTCAVSMDERFRTVSEFIDALEKTLDHNPWYPPSLPLESIYPSLVLINGKEHSMDVASLLPQGVLTPSLTLKDGVVLMQSNPFALAEVGMYDYLSAELKEVVEDILNGSDNKLSSLSIQDSTTESTLAMFATRVDISDRVIQRRLYYASDSLESLDDRLTLAYTHRTAMKDVKSSNDLMERLQQETIFERLEVARYERWLELDERGVQRKMFAIEKDCQTSEDWHGLASAHISLFGDWNSADIALTRANQNQPLNLQQAIENLQDKISIYGLRESFKNVDDMLDSLADSPSDYADIAKFWESVGADDAAIKAEDEQQVLLHSMVSSLGQRLMNVGVYIDPPTGNICDRDLIEFEQLVLEQEALHKILENLNVDLLRINVSLPLPSGELTESLVEDLRSQVA